MRLFLLGLISLAVTACAIDPTIQSNSPEESADRTRPNIVLVLFEDLSPRVGAFGDPIAYTPNFDRIAAEGVRYTNVFTTSGVCAPSRAALMAGRYQHTIGAQHMRTMAPAGGTGGGPQGYLAVPPADVKAFPELLRRAGYYASNDSKTDYQFGQPFTIWDESGRGADWSDRAPRQPFFHMVTLFNTHESAIWPVDLKETPENTSFFGLVERNRSAFATRQARTDPARVTVPPYLPDTPTVRRDIATHYDNIAHTDAALGKLYDRLVREDLLDSTILIVSSDHGDGLPRMKRSLYDSGLQVPMVIRFPNARDAGSTNDELISFVDLAPTILSWADVQKPSALAGFDFEGSDRDPVRTHVFAAQDRMDFDPNWRRAVRDKRYKLIQNFMPGDPYFVPLAFRDVQPSMQALWAGFRNETLPEAAKILFSPIPELQLYDTLNDPYEVENIIDDANYAEVRKTLTAALNEWATRYPDMSVVPEIEMIESMWPNGEQPVTAAPIFSQRIIDGRTVVSLASETEGASIGYRYDTSSDAWRIYTGPLDLPEGSNLQAKAIRYGYAESEISKLSRED